MNVLFLEWKSFGNEDMIATFEQLGYGVVKIPYTSEEKDVESVQKRIQKALTKESVFVFSFNYFPIVSESCQNLGVRYVAWVYDSPYNPVYSHTILNDCNAVFLFDYAMYQEMIEAGIKTVHYLPMAVYPKRLEKTGSDQKKNSVYQSDISFVGSLYSEKKNRLYERYQTIQPYIKGYLDGLVLAQTHVQGYNFLQEMLTPEIVEELEKVYPSNPNADTARTPAEIYADYILARKATAIERWRILECLGKQHPVKLYTYDQGIHIAGVQNCGPVDYYRDMPYVFFNSKVNLNISLRSIRTGIPLRAFDIMGCGGFLISNYQEELLEYFQPDEDFVYYESTEDLREKVDYYLSHDGKRMQIAASGCEKVRRDHTYELRVQEILRVIKEVSV